MSDKPQYQYPIRFNPNKIASDDPFSGTDGERERELYPESLHPEVIIDPYPTKPRSQSRQSKNPKLSKRK